VTVPQKDVEAMTPTSSLGRKHCELIAAAKAQPGELKFGSTGTGTGTHLGIVKFNLGAGIKVVDVPPQATDAIADVLDATIEGRTTYMMAPISITEVPRYWATS
jgi:tripartite-type tricarboxylate transporter receptor subunit TctC